MKDKKEIINLKGKTHKEVNETLGKISKKINDIIENKKIKKISMRIGKVCFKVKSVL